jgi:hypothetical protein
LHAFGDREAIRNTTLALHHLREGVVTEELMLDAHGQVADPSLHP